MSQWGRVVVIIALAIAAPAAADPAATATATTAPVAESRHAIYVELLGKGGLWGAGYDYQITRRFAVGAVGSYYVLGGDRYLTFSPYVAAYPVMRGSHRWFAQVGPQVVRRSTPSPVPEWDGMSTTAFAAEASSGYEYRRGVLVRVYAMASLGDRLVPGIGLSLGWSL
jgi:hypothetical protein